VNARARANRQFVRRLLAEKQPEFADALNTAAAGFCSCGHPEALPTRVEAIIALNAAFGFKLTSSAGLNR
jgi:hypothetical protein